jgi:steroid delta-isomerase-like uncharacterized protein
MNMSTDANKAIVVQLYDEVFNKGNLELAEKLVAEGAIEHDPNGLPVPSGPAGVTTVVTMLRTAFPDCHQTIEDLVAEGDRVAARLSFQGTHQGTFLGAAPTGKRISITMMHLYRFAGGKVAEVWANRDDVGVMRQLGLLPAPSPAASHS